jgi:hypothetical protein
MLTQWCDRMAQRTRAVAGLAGETGAISGKSGRERDLLTMPVPIGDKPAPEHAVAR